jgi:ketosteroid isomerase-like protein
MSLTLDDLIAIESIRDLARRYCHAIDRLDADMLASVYWPDAVDIRCGEHPGSGYDYVARAVSEHADLRVSLHCLHNHLVELDDGRRAARGQAYCVAYLFTDSPPTLRTWFGRYLDRYERRDGEWRIAHRSLVHEGSRTDDPLIEMPPVPDSFRLGSFDRGSRLRPIGP